MYDWAGLLADMSWVDYVILLVLIYFAFKGFMNGFSRELVAIGSWLLAFLVGAYAAPLWAEKLSSSITQPHIRWFLGFFATFVFILFIGKVVGNSTSVALRSIGLGSLNRLLGGAFGMAKGALITAIAFVLIGGMHEEIPEWWSNSLFLSDSSILTHWIDSFIPHDQIHVLEDKMQTTLADSYHAVVSDDSEEEGDADNI